MPRINPTFDSDEIVHIEEYRRRTGQKKAAAVRDLALQGLALQSVITSDIFKRYCQHNNLSCLEAIQNLIHYALDAQGYLEGTLMHRLDKDGRIIEVTDDWLCFFGYRRSQVIGRHIREFVTPESYNTSSAKYQEEFAAKGVIQNVPVIFVTKSGDEAHMLLTGSSDIDSEGKYKGGFALLKPRGREQTIQLADRTYQIRNLTEENKRSSLQIGHTKSATVLEGLSD